MNKFKVGDRVKATDRFFEWIKEDVPYVSEELTRRFKGRTGIIDKQYATSYLVHFESPDDEFVFCDFELEGEE